MSNSLEGQRALEAMQQHWWYLAGATAIVIGVPLVGMAMNSGSTFWTSFMGVVLVVYSVALVAFVIRHRKALRLLSKLSKSGNLDDEYTRESMQRGSALANGTTTSLLIIIPVVHYYVTPLSV